jgi:3-oxoacyl-[acyl-carrier-protein] synthase-3
VPAGGAQLPTTKETVEAGLHYLHVDDKREIFDLFVGYMIEATESVLGRARLSLADIDLLITHQGNATLTREIAEALGLPLEKVVDCVAKHGNTSGASVPLALDEALTQGRIKPGDTVLLASVGAGYAFGGAIHRF